ncbi:putative pectinesterase 11 [Triticum urartu]|uniref:pectinesterase n=2 Tax=Triticum urartu TaxID=4572 RepID=A0A8R7TWP3_TRIUA|nr:putative pectinesterase 11 [Triticum urartu]
MLNHREMLDRVNSAARVAILLALLCFCSATSSYSFPDDAACAGASGMAMPGPGNLLTVDQSGKGDYRKIHEAIAAAPVNSSARTVILIKPGVYKEKIVVPVDKPNITLFGTSANTTVITWNEPWLSTDTSPTVTVRASDFVASRLTFRNTFGTSKQAIAVRVAGDRAAFYGCSFSSFQDTLLDDNGRHYYCGCYIEGGTDFICGNGRALFEKCHLHSTSLTGGAFTAQKRASESNYTGYSFVGCKLTGVGVSTSILGRPWEPYSRVVFALTYMSAAVSPRGWNDWNHTANQRTAFYGQYQCYGQGAKTDGRVKWARNLSPTEAAPFMTKAWIDGQQWLPKQPAS